MESPCNWQKADVTVPRRLTVALLHVAQVVGYRRIHIRRAVSAIAMLKFCFLCALVLKGYAQDCNNAGTLSPP